MSNIARETGISVSTVRDRYGILVDTLTGAFLPAFTLRPRRRTIQSPKFYFRDLGVVNHLARRRTIRPGSEFEFWRNYFSVSSLRHASFSTSPITNFMEKSFLTEMEI
ncbi:MAG: hypothetical protein EHM49_10205 [Deltaproteobacteria bacterium]|nr:MAG: hypothetical protein EHM49_10205 [Deltaproteobacteria bacterium]